jgi:hypothetical protein
VDEEFPGVLRKRPLHKKGRAIKAGLFYWFMAKSNRHLLMDDCGRPSSGLDDKSSVRRGAKYAAEQDSDFAYAFAKAMADKCATPDRTAV